MLRAISPRNTAQVVPCEDAPGGGGNDANDSLPSLRVPAALGPIRIHCAALPAPTDDTSEAATHAHVEAWPVPHDDEPPGGPVIATMQSNDTATIATSDDHNSVHAQDDPRSEMPILASPPAAEDATAATPIACVPTTPSTPNLGAAWAAALQDANLGQPIATLHTNNSSTNMLQDPAATACYLNVVAEDADNETIPTSCNTVHATPHDDTKKLSLAGPPPEHGPARTATPSHAKLAPGELL